MKKPTLLFVDDEERILRSLRMLFFTGYEVRVTTDAHEAIRILKEQRIDVIVSDQRMPLMLGAELLRNAREVSPHTMRILLTGYSDLDASIACVNDGEVFRYLLKPWNGEEVKRVVAEAAAIAANSFAAAASPEPARAMAEQVNILVIDSDEATVEAVREILYGRAVVLWAETMSQATEMLSKHDIAVVVADVMLNGINIAYMLKSVKRLYPKTQSMVVTSFTDTSHLIELINQAQIARYLPKPLGKNMLSRNLDYLIGRFHALCHAPQQQTRSSVEPIADPREKEQSRGLMELLTRLRLGRATA